MCDINNDEMQDAFGWHLERAIIQIKSFAKIIHNIIVSFYGDMQSAENQENCMFNLMVSEIFEQREKIYSSVFQENLKSADFNFLLTGNN